MSDNWLILIPKSSGYVPSEEAQQRAIAYFRRIAPGADEIKVEISEYVRLIDCGANLEKIICSSCNKNLDIDWWRDWVAEEHELRFPLKSIPLPCCDAVRNLTELIYDWPQGFARFSLEAMNPNLRELPSDAQYHLESILGCSLLKIWQHL